MNEVEKMYRNVGIKQKYCNKVCEANRYPYQGWCKECKHLSTKYPPFTAEKQLELIKWLANKKLCISSPQAVNTYVDKFWHIGINPFNFKLDMVNDLTFEECLSGLVNYLWQDLTEEEKQQIKEILE